MAEVTVRDVEIIKLNEKIDRLQAIVDLYIMPMDEIFSEDDALRSSAQKAVTRRIERDRDAISSIPDIQEDIHINAKIDLLMHRHKPGEVLEKRLKRTEKLLIARRNEPIPFSEMKLLQEFKSQYRRQDMTKLGHTYELFPEKYEVRTSKLGGKTIRLTLAYFKHLTKGGE